MNQVVNISFRADNTQINNSIIEIKNNLTSLNETVSSTINFSAFTTALINSVDIVKKSVEKLAIPLQESFKFENLTTQLSPFVGGLEQATKITTHLREEAANGAKNFEELTQTATRLAGVFKSRQNITQWTSALHNLAAATGKSMKEITEAFTKAKTGNNAAGFLDQIGIYRQIAEQAGMSEIALKDLVKTSKISFAELESYILAATTGDGAFARIASELSNTTQGTIDTLSANWKIALAKMGDGISQAILPGLQETNALVVKLRPAFETVGEAVGWTISNLKTLTLVVASVSASFVNWSAIGSKIVASWKAVRGAFTTLAAHAKLTMTKITIATNTATRYGISGFRLFAIQARVALSSIAVVARVAMTAVKAAIVSTGVGVALVALGEALGWVYEKFMEWRDASTADARAQQEHKHRLEDVADAFADCATATDVAAEKSRQLATLKQELRDIELREIETGETLAKERSRNAQLAAEVETQAAAAIFDAKQKEIEQERVAAEERSRAADQKIAAMEAELAKSELVGAEKKRQILENLQLTQDELNFEIKYYRGINSLTAEQAAQLDRMITAKKEIHAIDKAIAENREKYAIDVEMMRAEIESEEALLKLKEQRFEAELRTKLLAAGYTGEALETELENYKKLRDELAQVRKERSAEKTLREETAKLAIAEAKASGNTELAAQLQNEYDLRKKIADLEREGIERATAENIAQRTITANSQLSTINSPLPTINSPLPTINSTLPTPHSPLIPDSLRDGIDGIRERTLAAVNLANTTLKAIETNTRHSTASAVLA